VACFTFPRAGSGPAAVADHIREIVRQPRIETKESRRRRLVLGSTPEGEELSLAVRGRNVLVAGDTRSGKSWFAGALCEQLILQRYCVCVLDPEGDYASLESLPTVMALGGGDSPPPFADLNRAFRYPDASLVIDLSHMALDDKVECVCYLLANLAAVRRESGLPHRIVVDEAHYFLHRPDVRRLLDLELAGYTLVTHRVSSLHPDVLSASEAIVVTRETDPAEIRALRSLTRAGSESADWEKLFAGLALDEAVLLPGAEEAGGAPRKFRVVPRITAHVRHRRKYLDIPVSDGQAFVFTRYGIATGIRARTMRDLAAALSTAEEGAFDAHLARGDISRWIASVFRDHQLASRIRGLERDHRLGEERAALAAMASLIHDRYEPPEEPAPAGATSPSRKPSA